MDGKRDSGSGAPSRSSGALEPRLGAAVGSAGVVVGFAGLVAAGRLSPGFGWWTDALSDLGVMSMGLLFNASLVVAGVCLTVFAVSLRGVVPDRASGRVGVALLASGGLALATVGIVTLDFGVLHTVAATAWFVLAPTGVSALGVAYLLEAGSETGRSPTEGWVGPRGLGIVSVACGTVALVAGPGVIVGIRAGGGAVGIAVPELVQALVVAAWLVVVAVSIARGSAG